MKRTLFAGFMVVALTAGSAHAMMNCGMMGGHGSHSSHSGEANTAREEVRGDLRDARREQASWYGAEQDRTRSDGETSEGLRQDGPYQKESASGVEKHNH